MFVKDFLKNHKNQERNKIQYNRTDFTISRNKQKTKENLRRKKLNIKWHKNTHKSTYSQ